MSAETKTVADILREAKALISDPEKWIKGADALADRNDDVTTDALYARDESASCFCAGGAIQRLGNGAVMVHALHAFAGVHGERFAHIFNDRPSTTHEDVMRTFDLAIAEAEKA